MASTETKETMCPERMVGRSRRTDTSRHWTASGRSLSARCSCSIWHDTTFRGARPEWTSSSSCRPSSSPGFCCVNSRPPGGCDSARSICGGRSACSALLVWLVLASMTATLAGDAEKVPWSVGGALFYVNDFLQAWTDRVAPAFNQSWSLSVEEQFYFVWPPVLVLILLRCSPRAQRRFLHASVLVAALIAFTQPNYFLPTGHLLPLVIGCWAAEQVARGYTPWVGRVIRAPWVAPAACAVLMLATVFEVPEFRVAMFIAVALAAAALVLNITSGRTNATTRLLSTTVPRWIGARSYGIYLYGLTLMHLIPILIPGIELKFATPLYIAATYVVVALSYRFIESPIRARGRRWLRQRTQQNPSSDTHLGSS